MVLSYKGPKHLKNMLSGVAPDAFVLKVNGDFIIILYIAVIFP